MTDGTSVFEFIKDNILEMKDIEPDDLVMESTLESIDLDSLDYVSVQLSIRKQFGIALDPELFATGQIATMHQLVDYIIAEKHMLAEHALAAQ